MTDAKTIDLPMVCLCQEQGKQEAAWRRNRVIEILKMQTEEELRTMTSGVLYALNAWYHPGWDLHWVGVDMWMGLTIKQWSENGDRVHLATDTLEDGLVAAFLYVYDNYARDE